jgi:hypothetical protein
MRTRKNNSRINGLLSLLSRSGQRAWFRSSRVVCTTIPQGYSLRTRRTCHIFWAIVSLEILRNSDYPNVEQIKRLTAELRELGEKRIRLAELHSRDCCVSAYGKLPLTPPVLLLVIGLSVTLKGRTTHNNVRERHLNCKDDTEILGASLAYECRLPLPLYLLQTQLSRNRDALLTSLCETLLLPRHIQRSI